MGPGVDMTASLHVSRLCISASQPGRVWSACVLLAVLSQGVIRVFDNRIVYTHRDARMDAAALQTCQRFVRLALTERYQHNVPAI